MFPSLSRRGLLALPLGFALVGASRAEAKPVGADDAARRLAGIEREFGGRLGVAILDTATGLAVSHRGDERFAMCSTFKALAAGFVLARVDKGQERLDRRIGYTEKDLLSFSPVTKARLAEGSMPVGDLCEATVTRSDNAAANLLLGSFGGPAGLTAWLRGLGDATTRLDRTEPELNEGKPGDPRDTTTPLAMADTLRRLVLGDALGPASRERLTGWLVGCKTGDARLRAGIPKDWLVGDKTGTSGKAAGISNDIGVVWPAGKAPVVVAAFLAGSPAPAADREAALAQVGRVVAMMAE
jgi:beta-lactamase class A